MKKLTALMLVLMLAIPLLLLSGCMPGDYSDELLKTTEKEYLDKGKAWFDENMPEVKSLVMEYRYNGSSLTDSLTGSYKSGGKTVKYMLMPDSGDLYTDELMPKLTEMVKDRFCLRTGIDADAVDDLFVLWDIPFCYLPGDLSESQTSPGSTGERLLPAAYTENDLDSIADAILTERDHPAILGVYIKTSNPESIDLSGFIGLTGLNRINLVTGDGDPVYEIIIDVADNGEKASQTVSLIKRPKMSTSEEILKTISSVS